LTSDLWPLYDFGQHMTVEQFREAVKEDWIFDEEGFGALATATQQSRISAIPSQISKQQLPEWATHVVWYPR
jgi:hypothetical protein